MTNVKIFFYTTLVLMVVIGCSTLQNAKYEDRALVVGEIRLINKDPQIKYLQETTAYGIKITFHSIETQKDITVSSNAEGLFSTDKLTEGIYEITEFNIERESGNTIHKLNTPERWKYFTVIKGKVNNLGLLIWTIEYRGWTVRYAGDYDTVKNKFLEKFSRNQRYAREWANRGFPIYLGAQTDPLTPDKEYIVEGDDASRYQELWIFWHLIAGEQVAPYPLPQPNEKVQDWVNRNLYLVPTTKIGSITLHFTIASGEKAGDNLADISLPALMRTDMPGSDSVSNRYFTYKGIDGTNLGGIIVVWLP